jgi:hypothetical protein
MDAEIKLCQGFPRHKAHLSAYWQTLFFKRIDPSHTQSRMSRQTLQSRGAAAVPMA